MITVYRPQVNVDALPVDISVKIDQHMKAINDLLVDAGFMPLGQLELRLPVSSSRQYGYMLRWKGYQ